MKCSKLYGCAKNRGADTTKFKEGHHKALLPQRLCIRKKGRKEDDLEAAGVLHDDTTGVLHDTTNLERQSLRAQQYSGSAG